MADHTFGVPPHHPLAVGWAVSTAMVILFILCVLFGLFVPTRGAHGAAFAADAASLGHTGAAMAASIVIAWTVTVGALVFYGRQRHRLRTVAALCRIRPIRKSTRIS